MTKTLEKYLQEIHAQEYNGIDDAMPEAFEKWLEEQDTGDIIGMAEKLIKDLQFCSQCGNARGLEHKDSCGSDD